MCRAASVRCRRLHVAQQAEKFTRGTRRFLSTGLDTGLANEGTQVLAISSRMLEQEFFDGLPKPEFSVNWIAFGNQAITPGFELMQDGDFAMELLPIAVENESNGLDLAIVEPAQLLGEVLGLAFSRDGLMGVAGAADFSDQGFIEGNAGELGVTQPGKGFSQFEYGHGVAAQLAAAGAIEFAFVVVE